MSQDLHEALSFDDDEGRLANPRRLRRLLDTGLLDSGRDVALDRLTRLAATFTGSAVAAVSLVDGDRQVYPGAFGLPVDQDAGRAMPLSYSFCKYVVMNDAPLALDDIREHPILRHSPAVTEFGVVAYAGVPLHGPEGDVLGALCVVEQQPVHWTTEQLDTLQDLAGSVEAELAVRLHSRDAEVAGVRLRQAIDGAAHTVFIAADRDGLITVVNQAAEDLLGAEAADLVGVRTLASLPELLSHSAHPPVRVDGVTPVDQVDLDAPVEWIVEDNHGRRRIVSFRITVLRDARGQEGGYVLIGTDVTAHHDTRAALHDVIGKQSDAVDRLLELNQARTDFIATASHELRTPVTSILGFTELLAEGAAGHLTADQARLLDRVDRNGQRLLRLVEDLLNLSHLDPAGPAPLERVVLEATAPAVRAWTSLKPLLRSRQLQADLVLDDDVLHVDGDLEQLERAIYHLLTNSVKFTPDGGSIKLSIFALGDDVVFEVADSGVGICDLEHAALFDPFFRTQEAHALATPGAGLGLAVVRTIVEAHQGQIELTSAREIGTTVQIRLPASRTV